MIVAFTGHRPDKLNGYKPCAWHDRIKDWIRTQLVEFKPERAISGMALGVDQWAAAICVALKIPFTAAVPFPGFELRWPAKARRHYETLIDAAASVHLVSDTVPIGYAEAVTMLDDRNRWMVDQLVPQIIGSKPVGFGDSEPILGESGRLIAVWDGSSGGTANTVRYAVDHIGAKAIVRLDPTPVKP